MEKLQNYLEHVWQPTVLYAIGAVVVCSLLFFRLGSLVKPYATNEIVAIQSSSEIGVIAENPIYVLHKLGQHTLQKLGHENPLAMRSISALLGVVAVWLFFYVAEFWFTTRMAALGSLLFATSSWFLHTTRAATPQVMSLGVLALIACGAWLRYSRRRTLSLVVAAVATAICLYIPGLVWFVLIFLLLQRRSIAQELRIIPAPAIILTILLWVSVVSPLVVAMLRDPAVGQAVLGLPKILNNLPGIGNNWLQIPLQLFVRGPENPAIWLGRLPLLDVFSAAMFVLGLYRLYFQRKLDRTKLLLGGLLIGSILVALGGPVNLIILLPFIYIIIMTGFSLLLQQWFTVFPRNPFARSLGVFLLSASVLLAVSYHVNRYFIAWPNTPATKATYIHQP